MKKIILFLILLLPMLAYAQPSIKIENEMHNFGEVKQGTQLDHTFEFENTGTEELEIKGLKTS